MKATLVHIFPCGWGCLFPPTQQEQTERFGIAQACRLLPSILGALQDSVARKTEAPRWGMQFVPRENSAVLCPACPTWDPRLQLFSWAPRFLWGDREGLKEQQVLRAVEP